MTRTQANLTAIMLVQQLDPDFWLGWVDKTPILLSQNGDCRPLLQEVVNRLNKEDIPVAESYGIIHDKDEISVWNQEQMKNVTELKAKHVHFLLKFEKGASIQKIALAIGVEPQYLEKLKSGRYGFENCLAYLVHAKDESKYQYSPDEVVTLLGEDYSSIYNRRMQIWIKGRATKEAKETSLSVDYLLSEVLKGNITKSNILLTDDYYKVYSLHKRKFVEAFDTFAERKGYKAISDIEAGNFKKTVIFIYAKSGQGKTRLAKYLIQLFQAESRKNGENWESCLTASTNAFDEYNSQEILFLDDIRGDSLTLSDWLKLLDPYTISHISARYHNKVGSAKVIIITSTRTPLEFFKLSKGSAGEDSGQFIRRIDYLLELTDDGYLLSIPLSKSLIKIRDNPESKHVFESLPNFSFGKQRKYKRGEAIYRLIKTVKRNMKWGQKKTISDTDQSSRDSHNSQQK